MDIDKTFYSNIFWRLVFTIPSNLKGLITLPLLTRLYSPNVYAAWTQIVLIHMLLTPLVSLRFETALVRFLSAEEKRNEMIRSIFTIGIIISILIILIALIFGNFLAFILFGSSTFGRLIPLVFVWACIKGLAYVGFSTLKAKEKILKVSILEFLSTILLISSAIIVFIMNWDKLEYLLLINIVGDLIICLFTIFQIGSGFPITGMSKVVKTFSKFIHYVWPLNINSLLMWFTETIDKFLIIHLMSLAAMAPYHVALALSQGIILVFQPVNYVLFPRVSKLWNDNNPEEVTQYFSEAVKIILVFGLPMAVCLPLLYPDIIKIIAGTNYSISKIVVFLLSLSTIFKLIYNSHLFPIHLQEKTYMLPVLFATTSLSNLMMGYILIPWLKLEGAALAKMITFLIMASIVTIWSRGVINVRLPLAIFFKLIPALSIMGIVLWVLLRVAFYHFILDIIICGLIYLSILTMFRILDLKYVKKILTAPFVR